MEGERGDFFQGFLRRHRFKSFKVLLGASAQGQSQIGCSSVEMRRRREASAASGPTFSGQAQGIEFFGVYRV